MYPAARGTGLCHLERSGVPCECCAPENTVNQGKVPPARAAIVHVQAITLPKKAHNAMSSPSQSTHHPTSTHLAAVSPRSRQNRRNRARPLTSSTSATGSRVSDLQCVCGVQKKRSNRQSIRALDCAPRASQWFCSVRK